MEEKVKTFMRATAVWAHHTLLVIGVAATFAFVRINWFNGEFTLAAPTIPLVMDPAKARTLR